MDVPRQIGRYRILEPLGSGSMARVFLALDPHTDRKIALKVVAPSGADETQLTEEALRRRFLLEARAAGRLNHPGIVTVYDADTDAASGLAYIAMEWVAGASLAALMAREHPLPIPLAAEIVAQVALALEYAHRQGIVHRDVKPANVLVTDDGRAKLSDFGIARLVAESHTLAGQILGTPHYMSPEQVKNDPVDGRSDLYSLGVVLYEAVTGVVPSRGDSLASIAYRIAHVEPRPPASYNPAIDGTLGAVIERALAKDPAERFQSGVELADALAPYRSGHAAQPSREPLRSGAETIATTTSALGMPAPAASSPVDARRFRRWLIAGSAAVLLATLALVLTVERPRRQAPPAEPVTSRQSAPEPDAVTAPPPASTPSAPIATSTLRLVHNNRLRSAVLTIWVDGERLHSARMEAQKGLLQRVGGDAVEWSLTVPEGEHTLEVRITSAQGQVDASGTVRGRFTAGGSRVLRVLLIPFNERLRLSWEE